MSNLKSLLVEMQQSFEIPMENNTTLEFKDFLFNKLDDYYNFIKKEEQQSIVKSCIELNNSQSNLSFSNIDDFNGRIKTLINGLKKVLTLYYEGKPAASYQKFKRTLKVTKIKELFGRKYSMFSGIESPLYRTRKDENKLFTKTDLFHIGFENRHLIGTTRYSIPGFPALYLGSSTFVCWKEFNEYSLKKLWFSSFKLNKGGDYCVLSIDRVQEILEALNRGSKIYVLVIRSLATFPLMIACSVRTKHHEKPFKPEYIIPQLLTQYIAEDEYIDGIRYPSTKVDYSKLKNVSAYNYVFPARKIKNKGYCEKVSDIFNLTEPINLKREELLNNSSTATLGKALTREEKSKKIMLTKGRWSSYINSSFGKIEKILKEKSIVSRMPIDSLANLIKFSSIYKKYPKSPYFATAKSLGNWSFIVTKS
ncbi:RES domain-containing protein [Flexibacter flexilis DSM 6793]|uniref:RES domain-containing protein n=1 Tax=Flexibacter flexilis DSM 6793 TaxID=927664 RepID=A0A1I1G4M2_9BACT|nr:RES domain-containing protein [Flexibacter flexilis]SFC06697.1 RES domain-containing protein [Flexibacter flexilis DSM 6793]